MSAPDTVASEQAQELAALQAAAMEQAAQPDPLAQQQAIAAQSSADKIRTELAGLVLAFVGIAKPILPSLAEIYTPETTDTAAAAVAAVCVKHGWLSDGIMGDYGEEIAAAAVLLPLGFATVQGVRGDLAARRAQDEKPAQPGRLSDTVRPEQPPPMAGAGQVAQPGVMFGDPVAPVS